MLEKVFTARRFHLDALPEGQDRLRIALRYADPDRVKVGLRAFGLEGYVGTFFLNSALQIQGTLQLGLDTFTQEAQDGMEMGVLIQDRDRKAQEEIERTCSCAWTVAWRPDIRLRRLTDPEEVLAQVRTIYETLHRRDLEYFQERVKTLEMRVQALEEGDQFHDLIGRSPQMHQVYRLIQQVAASDLSVLIRGESGVGKELVARAIHQSSPRRERPFVAVNCAALLETLLESELFGHEKGAFTGADRAKPGRFEMADGGTLFLDEVGDIPLTTQVKLLRVLETKAFERVGGTRTVSADVRILGATHRDLEDLIAKGQFREDLYFRLNVLPLHLPPLREHREDIPLLARAFLRRIALRSGRDIRGLSRGALERLTAHPWPGNIRELQNVLERAVAVYAKGPTLTESEVAQALGIQVRQAPAHPLSLRQQR
ncbi:sigma-54-dependent Fis family transcriptional regulator, partial [bacterium]|nr:sigma-54-dependent Fis family transcriptional regulator [bacterium]